MNVKHTGGVKRFGPRSAEKKETPEKTGRAIATFNSWSPGILGTLRCLYLTQSGAVHLNKHAVRPAWWMKWCMDSFLSTVGVPGHRLKIWTPQLARDCCYERAKKAEFFLFVRQTRQWNTEGFIKAKISRVYVRKEGKDAVADSLSNCRVQIYLTAAHLICLKHSEKLHVWWCAATTGCQFEERFVIPVPVGSVDWAAQLESC